MGSLRPRVPCRQRGLVTSENLTIWSQIEQLLDGATRSVILIAPFIKLDVFRRAVESIPDGVSEILCITRWSVPEIAAGVSDPEIIALAVGDPRINIRLLHNLHAKAFLADGRCLVGSANLTGKATGLVPNANVEIVIEVPSEHPAVQRLIEETRGAVAATPELARALREQADLLAANDRTLVISTETEEVPAQWLPVTRNPRHLYNMYTGVADVPVGVRKDLVYDLACINPPAGLSKAEFGALIRERLRELPLLRDLFATGRLANLDLQRLLKDEYDQDEAEARRRTETIAAWLEHFDDFYADTTSWELRPGRSL